MTLMKILHHMKKRPLRRAPFIKRPCSVKLFPMSTMISMGIQKVQPNKMRNRAQMGRHRNNRAPKRKKMMMIQTILTQNRRSPQVRMISTSQTIIQRMRLPSLWLRRLQDLNQQQTPSTRLALMSLKSKLNSTEKKQFSLNMISSHQQNIPQRKWKKSRRMLKSNNKSWSSVLRKF